MCVKRVTHGSWIFSISMSHHTYIHKLGPNENFCQIPTPRRPFYPNPNLCAPAVYYFDRRRKSLSHVTFFLICVTVDHRNMETLNWSKLIARIPPLSSIGNFSL